MSAVEKLRNYPGLDDGGALPETTLAFFLDVAKDTILRRRFPFDPAQTEMPTEYEGIQLRMAVEMISKIGAEGQVAHAENNITREYASETISPSLLRMVVPKAGTL